MEVLIILLIVLSMFPVEKIVDKKLFWDHGKSDKPWSTIGRAIIIAIASVWLFNDYLYWPDIIYQWCLNMIVFGALYMLYDQFLNIVKWKTLPIARNRKLTEMMVEDITKGVGLIHHKELDKQLDRYYKLYLKNYIDFLSTKEKIFYYLDYYSIKLFYHGDENTKSIYDKMFQKIPWYGEVFFKAVIIYSSIAIYYNNTFVDDLIYLLIDRL